MSLILETQETAKDRVLIVEAELPLSNLIATSVQRELHCEVHSAVDREEAEALLDCYKYNIAIIDLSLSPQRLDGLNLIEEIADRHGRPRIVALSEHGTDRIKSLALAVGADVFIERPRTLSDLASTLRQLVRATSFVSRKPLTGRVLQQLLSE